MQQRLRVPALAQADDLLVRLDDCLGLTQMQPTHLQDQQLVLDREPRPRAPVELVRQLRRLLPAERCRPARLLAPLPQPELVVQLGKLPELQRHYLQVQELKVRESV